MRRMLLLIGLATLVMACGDTGVTDLSPNGASRVIQDANTDNGGNEAFFWLSPIVKNPLYAGVFNPLLKPTVVICTLGAPDAAGDQVCVGDPLASYTMSAGTDGNTLSVSTADQHYKVNWQTKNYALDSSTTYRIQVFLTTAPGSERLGFADVVFAENMQAAKNLTTGDDIALVDGSTLPISFRIEEGVSCNVDTDCGEGSIGPEGGTVTTAGGFAGVEVPAGAVDGDILIKIRRIKPEGQPWGRCLPTGLRQEEGCYEFDTEPSIEAVNGEPTFNPPGVIVGVCIDPQAIRDDRLALHKFDPENTEAGVVQLPPAVEDFLTCDGFAYSEGSGFFHRFAGTAQRLLSPVARLIGGTPLFATDAGRGGVADAFSFIGWAEPLALAVGSAPVAVLPGAAVPTTLLARTAHNHGDTAFIASGHELRFTYADPQGAQPPPTSIPTAADGSASPAWTLTREIGVHTLTVSTQMEIDVAGVPTLIPDPTPLLAVQVGGYTSATDCEESTDCGQAIVGVDGDTVVTANGFAGVAVPEGALAGPVLITIRRVNPSAQPWQECLPTGLRQEEGCYEFDTEPSIQEVNGQPTFFGDGVVVGVCLDPTAVREDNLTLHKYDPDDPTGGVKELPGATETFLTCGDFAATTAAADGFFGIFARSARRLLSPVARTFGATPLYATDAGRGGVADAFSYIGWAEPVALSASAPLAVLPGTSAGAVIRAATTHNDQTVGAVAASGHTLRAVYAAPETPTALAPVTTASTGDATPAWTISTTVGVHTLRVSTRMVVNGVEIPDPTALLDVVVGGFNAAEACGTSTDCGQAIVGAAGDTVLTENGYAGVDIPPGAVEEPVLITIRRIVPGDQPWQKCLPTGLRQEEGCYEFDTEPSLDQVNGTANNTDTFNEDVIVGVCIVPNAIRPDRLTLHKYDPEQPATGVQELAGAPADFLTCSGFAAIPNGMFGRLASAGRQLLSPVLGAVAPRPLYATDAGRGGVADAFSFMGWAEPVTLSLATEPNALDASITDVVVTAATAHNHGSTALPSDGTTIRFEYTDPSGNVTVSDVVTTLAGAAATSRISLTAQAGTHNVRASTQQEILIDSDLIISGAATGMGIFAAPTISWAGVPTPFLVPDPTLVVESGDLTVFGLVSLWTADGDRLLADVVGPNHGSATGAVEATTGISGNGLRFDGTGGVVTAGAAGFGAAAQWTLGAWVNLDPAGDPLAIQRFVTMGTPGNPKGVLRQELAEAAEARKLHLYGGFGRGFEDFAHVWEPSALVAGCWHHVVGTYDGKYLKLYRDGILAGEAGVGLTGVTADQITFSWSEAPLTGTLDEIEVHNHALSATEVAAAYSSKTVPSCGFGTVTGRVTDAVTGSPLAGAVVSVPGTSHGAVTDASGFYFFRAPSGSQTVEVSMSGYEPSSSVVSIPTADGVTHSVTLQPAVATGTIRGTVLDDAGGPIPGLTVSMLLCTAESTLGSDGTCVRDPSFFGTAVSTNADGVYERRNLDIGIYQVAVNLEGTGFAATHPGNHVVEIVSGGAIVDASFVASALASLTGTLTDNISGAPIQGAQVTYSPDVAAVLTDAQGSFLVPDLPAGGHTFTFAAEGYHSSAWFGEFTAGEAKQIDYGLFAVVDFAGSAIDPAGDARTGPDMLGGGASTDGLWFTFRARVANDASAASGVWIQWNLNLDENAKTGYQMSDTSSINNLAKVGAEYLVTLDGNNVLLHRWSGSGFVLEPQNLTVTIVDDATGGRTYRIVGLRNNQLWDDGRMHVNIITANLEESGGFDARPADDLDTGWIVVTDVAS